MKKIICICLIFLAVHTTPVYASLTLANQLPHQVELVINAGKRLVYITPYGKRYHGKDCPRTKATTATTAKRARAAGLQPCSYCFPRY